jgi:hypothetical protein
VVFPDHHLGMMAEERGMLEATVLSHDVSYVTRLRQLSYFDLEREKAGVSRCEFLQRQRT